ncbi:MULTISPECIES: hypothetical protein [Providencia]|uniref:hypothetical protein n=1 Tax=Providencia TaxID=586 RepID=UPI001E45C2CC|nr:MULTISPECIES: hypothetical protein [Providencia]MCD2527342.1 hypothetical protein [Providencia huaxiensis]UPS62247.1 hypothetical protein M0M83_16760 [Providencia rettgeri]
MAKTAAERKAEQRKRQKDSGEMKFELIVDSQELEMLRQNCALRRPGREPYDMNEYIQLLIIKDNQELTEKYKQLSNECCGKCGESLPVAECCLSGAADCWNTKGWHELSLSKIGVTCHEIKS